MHITGSNRLNAQQTSRCGCRLTERARAANMQIPDILLRFNGSVIPKILIEITISTALGFMCAYKMQEQDVWSPMGHQVVGTLLAFLVVFRSQIAWRTPVYKTPAAP